MLSWNAKDWMSAPVGTAQTLMVFGHIERILMGMVSEDSRFLVSAGCDGTIRFWDLKKTNWLNFKMI
jgi:WD40 repeat protein